VELGVEKVGRHNSISIRYRLQGRPKRQSLTIFVITTAGTFYCGWLDRWHEEGIPERIEHEYENDLSSALNWTVDRWPGGFGPVSLEKIQRKWSAVRNVVRLTVHKLRLSKRRLTGKAGDPETPEARLTKLRHVRELDYKVRTQTSPRI
jgi:hypothetical protein